MSDLLARHRAVIPNWVTLYYDEPIEIVSGRGSRVTDAEGRTYLDFFAGIVTNTLGYDVAEVREAVERHPEVEAAYTVAGEASAMLHVRARDTSHLEQALERIRDNPGVARTQTQIVLSTLFERPFRETLE